MSDDFPIHRTRSDLEKLLADGGMEGTRLEFKASAALTRDGRQTDEMCINVSAMANSAGGQIIYGIDEAKKSQGPIRVDDGICDVSITREWIGQILNARVQPRMNDVRIDEIDLGSGKRGFAISVAPTKIGPHQAPDSRYYKRFELEVRPMADYEVRDVMSRTTAPYLEPVLTFDGRETTALNFASNPQASDPIGLNVTLHNLASVQAEYTGFVIGFDISFLPTMRPPMMPIGRFADQNGNTLNWFQRRISVPTDFPIFKELPFEALPPDNYLALPEHALKIRGFLIRVRVYSPGFSCDRAWSIQNSGSRLKIISLD
ncbi:MAG: ATP-binding protein [Rhizobiales bacterium]|nr:ATP-binding protein [Hyphomicrobiales bacterium]